ncbi:hypothetical protein AUTU_45710 (plasmid) [Aureibacter tunicatorum]|nr:hypothetical protein AUTU_45710 [Aureibacter tunicatorum]
MHWLFTAIITIQALAGWGQSSPFGEVPEQEAFEGRKFEYEFELLNSPPNGEQWLFRLDMQSLEKGIVLQSMTSPVINWSPGEEDNGIHEVTVFASSSIGDFESSLRIRVVEVNSAPSFTISKKILEQLEDDGSVVYENFVMDLFDGDQGLQKMEFILSATNLEMFAQEPFIDAETRQLRFELAPNQNGISEIMVYLKDNGGTDHGGIDFSATDKFFINVIPVNDPPQIKHDGDIEIYANENLDEIKFSVIDPDKDDEVSLVFDFIDENEIIYPESIELEKQEDGYVIWLENKHGKSGQAVLKLLASDGGFENAQDSIVISILPIEIDPDIPTMFTPNDDGVNDDWEIHNLDAYENNEVSVYTRHGKLVFHTKYYNIENRWNGKGQNTGLVSEGVHVYKIDLGNGTVLEGSVLVKK